MRHFFLICHITNLQLDKGEWTHFVMMSFRFTRTTIQTLVKKGKIDTFTFCLSCPLFNRYPLFIFQQIRVLPPFGFCYPIWQALSFKLRLNVSDSV